MTTKVWGPHDERKQIPGDSGEKTTITKNRIDQRKGKRRVRARKRRSKKRRRGRSVRSGEEKGGKTREWRKGSREREAKGGRRRGHSARMTDGEEERRRS